MGRLETADRGQASGRFRRIVSIPARFGEGRLTERTPAVQPRRRELIFMPIADPLGPGSLPLRDTHPPLELPM